MSKFNIIKLANRETNHLFEAQILTNGNGTCTMLYTIEHSNGAEVFHDEFTFFDNEREHETLKLLAQVQKDFTKTSF